MEKAKSILTSSILSIMLLSFAEGGMVMLVELCMAKILAPYFGTSIQIWAATLAVTLGGLTSGYFYGGYLAGKNTKKDMLILRNLLYLAAIFIVLIPVFSDSIMNYFINYELKIGAVITLMILLFPVLFLFGSCSPLIISILNDTNKNAGKTAGTVYAISTLGGIFFTLFTGFYFIPILGIKFTLIFGGFLIAILTLLIIPFWKSKIGFVMILGLFISSIYGMTYTKGSNPEFRIIYETDGLLGNIKIIEHSASWFGQANKTGRGLVVNNTLQSYIDINNPEQSSIWSWSTIIPSALSVYPKGKTKVLLCGLGGGTIVKQLEILGFDYDIVELDKRIFDLAKEYFFLPKDTKVTIDDARHYIKTCNKKYDIVIFDTFLSESAPEHLLTKEAILDVERILNPDGMLLSNFYGFTEGQTGYAARSVIKTFQKSNLLTRVIATPGEEKYRNLFIIGSKKDHDFSKVNYREPGSVFISDLRPLLLPLEKLDMINAEVLEDNKPRLSKLYAEAALSWKTAYNDFYTKAFNKNLNN